MADEKPEEKKLTVVPERPAAQPVVQNSVIEEFVAPKQEIATLELSSEQRAILEDFIPDEDLDILPTGEIYCSQVMYRRKLNKVFGPGGWCMVEKSQPILKDNVVMQKWALYAMGTLISVAWGEQQYFPQNSRMTYATALESQKSNALTRCCKDLGIASQCWDRHWTEKFKAEHCVKVFVKSTRTQSGWEAVWRRSDAAPLWNEREELEKTKQGLARPVTPPTVAQEEVQVTTFTSPEPPPAPAGRAPKPRGTTTFKRDEPQRITKEQAKEVADKVRKADANMTAMLAFFKISTVEDLTTEQLPVALRILDKRLDQSKLKL